MGFLVYWKFLMKIPPKKSKSKINSTTGLFPKRPTILLKLGFTNKLTKFPGDSSRDLCIPDRWRSLYPLKGHLTIESHGNQQFQSVVFRLFSRRFYLFNEGQKKPFHLDEFFPGGFGFKIPGRLGKSTSHDTRSDLSTHRSTHGCELHDSKLGCWQKNGNIETDKKTSTCFFFETTAGNDDDGPKKRGFNHIHAYIVYRWFIYIYMYGFKGDITASHKSSTCKMGRLIVGRLTSFDGTVNDFSGRFLSVYVFWSQPATVGGREIFFCNILLPRGCLRCQCGKTGGVDLI